MGCSARMVKALFGVLALVMFIFLILVGVLETGGTYKTTITPPTTTTTTTTVKMHPKESFNHIDQTDLNYMSKRKVPNGPDPIHNRRTGNSRQPPGQA